MPSWSWIPITLAAALAQTLRNAAQRHLTRDLGALGATLVRFVYGLPFALLWLAIVWLAITPGRPQTIINLPPNREPTSEMRKRYSTDYTFTYPSRTIVVAVNPITGDDRILDARAAREVDELLDAAAAASRVNR